MKELATMTTAHYKEFVQPEDTALQGCKRSAELDSNTAGRSSSKPPASRVALFFITLQ